MTTYTDLELDGILDEFLGEGPNAAPDRAIDAALGRIDHVNQRGRGVSAGWAQMPTVARLLVAAALLIAAFAIGALVVGTRPDDRPAPSQAVPTAAASAFQPSTPPPSPTALSAVTPEPVTPAMALALEAAGRTDRAITATKGPLGITDADQSRLLQLIDDVKTALAGRSDPAAASDAVEALAVDVAVRTEPLAEERRARLRAAIAALRGAVAAKPFEPEELAPGTWYTTRFAPVTALTVPEGWSRNLEDAEVLALRKGGLTLAVTKIAADATAAGVAKALGNPPADSLSPAPQAVTFPSYVGATSGLSEGGGTLWFTESLQAFDAAPTDAVRAWVLQAGSRPLTIYLSGPPDEVAAAVPEVEQMLGTMVVGQR
jgi:hypothetical protein